MRLNKISMPVELIKPNPCSFKIIMSVDNDIATGDLRRYMSGDQRQLIEKNNYYEIIENQYFRLTVKLARMNNGRFYFVDKEHKSYLSSPATIFNLFNAIATNKLKPNAGWIETIWTIKKKIKHYLWFEEAHFTI